MTNVDAIIRTLGAREWVSLDDLYSICRTHDDDLFDYFGVIVRHCNDKMNNEPYLKGAWAIEALQAKKREAGR